MKCEIDVRELKLGTKLKVTTNNNELQQITISQQQTNYKLTCN